MEAAVEQPGPAQPAELVSADVPEQQQVAEPAPQAQGPGAAAVQRPGPPPSARRTVVESPVIMLPGAGEQPRQLARSTVNFALLLPTLPGPSAPLPGPPAPWGSLPAAACAPSRALRPQRWQQPALPPLLLLRLPPPLPPPTLRQLPPQNPPPHHRSRGAVAQHQPAAAPRALHRAAVPAGGGRRACCSGGGGHVRPALLGPHPQLHCAIAQPTGAAQRLAAARHGTARATRVGAAACAACSPTGGCTLNLLPQAARSTDRAHERAAQAGRGWIWCCTDSAAPGGVAAAGLPALRVCRPPLARLPTAAPPPLLPPCSRSTGRRGARAWPMMTATTGASMARSRCGGAAESSAAVLPCQHARQGSICGCCPSGCSHSSFGCV